MSRGDLKVMGVGTLCCIAGIFAVRGAFYVSIPLGFAAGWLLSKCEWKSP